MNYETTSYRITPELVEDSEPIDGTREFLEHLPKIKTSVIYTNEDQTEHKKTTNFLITGDFDYSTDDKKIMGAIKRVYDERLAGKKLYVRVYPEISHFSVGDVGKEKTVYARFLIDEDNE